METRARKADMEFTYTFVDKLFRMSIGETGDFSSAMYNRDYSLSLEEAQARKHADIVRYLGIGNGSRVLDIGSGWGNMLKVVRDQGGEGVGITLSSGQAKACRAHGFEIFEMNFHDVSPEVVGHFDAIVCLGVSGHICTVEDWRNGTQDQVYTHFFRSMRELLKPGGRFYIDTLVFDQEKATTYSDLDIHADKQSDAFYLALMEKQFPGSWLAYGAEQVSRNAEPFFRVISREDAREDYIETTLQWNRRFRKLSLSKLALYLKYLPKYLRDREFRYWVSILKYNPHRVCMERKLMYLYRWVLERREDIA